MNQFLLGANAMGFMLVSAYFFRFWQRTRDALFVWFSLSFAVQAVAQGTFAAFAASANESRPAFYLPRLLAYCLILIAIVAKNRSSTQNGPGL